jgi:hypothetical protein
MMNIQTVKTNLENTIAGKEKMLTQTQDTLSLYTSGVNKTADVEHLMALRATIEFLEINIGELKRILEDVEQCIEKETT